MPNASSSFAIPIRSGPDLTIEEMFKLTKIDRWVQIKEIVDFEEELATARIENENLSNQ